MKRTAILFCLIWMFGCTGERATESAGTDSETDSPGGDGGDSDTTVEVLPCERLFGAPSAQTGLDEAQCAPLCECDDDRFSPPTYSSDAIAAMRALTLRDPPEVPDEDPYTEDATLPDTAGVCAVLRDKVDPDAYRLVTFDTTADAEKSGGAVTHRGACGLCSSLADLAVYIEIPDLTEPVRTCGITGAMLGEQANLDCLAELGFTPACARIWFYNTVNTRTRCQDICITLLDAPYQNADGALNDCLQCDEDNSGPVFKAVAGRTRRNSGIPSGICRPCDTVAKIVHNYL